MAKLSLFPIDFRASAWMRIRTIWRVWHCWPMRPEKIPNYSVSLRPVETHATDDLQFENESFENDSQDVSVGNVTAKIPLVVARLVCVEEKFSRRRWLVIESQSWFGAAGCRTCETRAFLPLFVTVTRNGFKLALFAVLLFVATKRFNQKLVGERVATCGSVENCERVDETGRIWEISSKFSDYKTSKHTTVVLLRRLHKNPRDQVVWTFLDHLFQADWHWCAPPGRGERLSGPVVCRCASLWTTVRPGRALQIWILKHFTHIDLQTGYVVLTYDSMWAFVHHFAAGIASRVSSQTETNQSDQTVLNRSVFDQNIEDIA